MINFSEKRERQRIASEKKEKFSAAIIKKKGRLRWVFPCGKKDPLCLRLRKASAVVCQREDVLAPFCHCKCQVEH